MGFNIMGFWAVGFTLSWALTFKAGLGLSGIWLGILSGSTFVGQSPHCVSINHMWKICLVLLLLQHTDKPCTVVCLSGTKHSTTGMPAFTTCLTDGCMHQAYTARACIYWPGELEVAPHPSSPGWLARVIIMLTTHCKTALFSHEDRMHLKWGSGGHNALHTLVCSHAQTSLGLLSCSLL